MAEQIITMFGITGCEMAVGHYASDAIERIKGDALIEHKKQRAEMEARGVVLAPPVLVENCQSLDYDGIKCLWMSAIIEEESHVAA